MTPSPQSGAWQVIGVPEQTPLVQSAGTVQPAPVSQVRAGAHEPPQSTPVSVPFIWPSVHEAAGTQVPLALHVPPPVHVAPVRGVLTGWPATHSSVVHSLLSSTGVQVGASIGGRASIVVPPSSPLHAAMTAADKASSQVV